MFELKFTIDQLRVIDMALKEMPYKLAAPLIEDINKQIQNAANPVGVSTGGAVPAPDEQSA